MARLLGVSPETIRRWEAGREAEGAARLLLQAFGEALDAAGPAAAPRVVKLLQTSSDLGLSYLLLHLLNAYARAPAAPGPETPA